MQYYTKRVFDCYIDFRCGKKTRKFSATLGIFGADSTRTISVNAAKWHNSTEYSSKKEGRLHRTNGLCPRPKADRRAGMGLRDLMWRPMLCGAGDAASPWDARERPRTPHNF